MGGPPKPAPWRVAVYIRLSREDGNDESLSVTNQKKVIAEFLETGFQGPYLLAGQYVDDGASGTGYDRPAFQRMLRDMEAGHINCVVCKNLSRAFRNYADQGYFLEYYFPLHGVRFVTLGDPKIDSYLNPEMMHGLEVPISGLMNDRYAAKTSSDIRRTFDTKRRRGEFIGAFAPYGYRKDPDDKNHLLPDGEAAGVVRRIFSWFVEEGLSKRGIVKRLNELGIPNPTAYKRAAGLRYENPHAGTGGGLWCAKTVGDILRSPVYLGTMVQGRQRVLSYKVHDRVSVPREEWYVAENAHEPIIPRPLFDAAQALAARNTRTPPGSGAVCLLSGFVRCAECGKAMHRHASKGYVYYHCRTYRDQGGGFCGKNAIRADALEQIILTALQGQIARLADPAALAEEIRRAPAGPNPAARLAGLLGQKEQEQDRIRFLRDGLYLDWKGGSLTHGDYLRMRLRLDGQLEQLEQAARALREELRAAENSPPPAPPNLTAFLERGTVDRLDRGLLAAAVDTVLVSASRVEIRFAFPAP